ncbi:DUF2214 domain-containing protein [Falsiroseomonas oryziterrae]|uniref:DUF2214 domain-containing protein n=1 Tax=Falsiroseomonas oryziterrae TaxID=2911368 RepID=UPI001F4037E3|nr:DUF2214 domain-containing protein [Roseomonas sp. NPKOSM-4]
MDLAAVEALPLFRFVGLAPGVYPLVSALHVMGIALLFGPILLADLRWLGAIGPRLDEALPLLRRTAAAGLALAATTGVLLAGVRIGEYAANPAFLVKLLLVALGVGNALLAARAARRGRIPAGFALASLLCWTAAILAGRWIAFV